MKFTFDYEETLMRSITIEADSLAQAIIKIENQIDNQEIVLTTEDFLSGKISMPLDKNILPRLVNCGEDVKVADDFEIVIDFW